MLDLLTRACRHPLLYASVLRRHTLVFKERIQESETTYSYIFSPTTTLSWHPGQHAIFSLSKRVQEGKNWRPFSVASAPHEGVIRIGTTIPEPHSDFKQRLLELRSGDTLFMRGPFGEFCVPRTATHIIGIAGGIGITPLRSIIAAAAHSHDPRPITLIYSATNTHVYGTEFDAWHRLHPHLNVIYVRTIDETNNAIRDLVRIHANTAHYFVSGSPNMIKAVRTDLHNLGVRNVYNDPFKGYLL